MTPASAFGYGRAATTRSCARFIFEVATISIVRVILRVCSTDFIRPLSSRPLAIDHLGGRDGRCRSLATLGMTVILSEAKDLHLLSSPRHRLAAVNFAAPVPAVFLYSSMPRLKSASVSL